MSFFTTLFASKAPERQSVRKETVALIGPSRFELRITGEEHFQAALETICGPHAPTGVRRSETAWLLPDDRNPRDKNAVRVEIRGRQVGLLSPEHALLVRRQLLARGKPEANAQCQAVITGGWMSSDGRKGAYEVWLDVPTSHQ